MGRSHACMRIVAMPAWLIYLMVQGCLPTGAMGPPAVTGDPEAPRDPGEATSSPLVAPAVETCIARANVLLPGGDSRAQPMIEIDAIPEATLTLPARQTLTIALQGQATWQEDDTGSVAMSLTVELLEDDAWMPMGEQTVRGSRQGPDVATGRPAIAVVFDEPATYQLRARAAITVWTNDPVVGNAIPTEDTAEVLLSVNVTPSSITVTPEQSLPQSPFGPQWLQPVQ